MPARFVFDTNAVVSAALLSKSKSRQAFDRAKQIGQLLVSVETIAELNDVLRRDDFAQYISEALRIEFLATLLFNVLLDPIAAVFGWRGLHCRRLSCLATSSLF